METPSGNSFNLSSMDQVMFEKNTSTYGSNTKPVITNTNNVFAAPNPTRIPELTLILRNS